MALLTVSRNSKSLTEYLSWRSQLAAVIILALAVAILASWFFLHRSDDEVIESPRLELVVDGEVSNESVRFARLLPGGVIKQYNLKLDGIKAAITSFEVLETEGKPPVVINWQSHVNQPIFRSDIYVKEELQLFEALDKYLPANSTVLAFPELSYRIKYLLSDADVPMANVAPVASAQMPEGWLDSSVLPYTRPEINDSEASRQIWMGFRKALIAEDPYGAAQMRALSGNDDTYIVLHLRDIFDLGAELGDKFLVAMKDFQGDSHAHDLTRMIKDWQTVNNYASHAAAKTPDGRLRVYFLSDAKDKSTTIGQLLPFDGARVGLAPGTKLVFQAGGYWVYKLLPV